MKQKQTFTHMNAGESFAVRSVQGGYRCTCRETIVRFVDVFGAEHFFHPTPLCDGFVLQTRTLESSIAFCETLERLPDSALSALIYDKGVS